MAVQPRNDGRAVARARYRILTGRSPKTPAPATAAAVNTGRAGTFEVRYQPGGSPDLPAPDPGAQDRRSNVIVGHRLANGHISVHAPGQQCGLAACARAGSQAPGRHRRPQAGRGRVRRAMQSLAAAIAATMARSSSG